jgi:hypothetical protein
MRLKRLLANPAALLAVLVALDVFVAVRVHMQTVPKPLPVLEQFASTIDEQYHECVPLGWFPDSRPWRAYFPANTTNVAAKDGMYQGLWVAVLPSRTPSDPRAVRIKAVLDELTRVGLLVRSEIPETPGSVRYNLTDDGRRYYYDNNHYGNNVEGWSYLCFSRLHATRVAWSSLPSKARKRNGGVTARIRFTWKPSEDAAWATPFIKAHAVELNPTSSPAEATVHQRFDGIWRLSEFDFAFPLVEDRSAWTTAG